MPAAPLTQLAGHSVLFVMATQAEFGPHLRARIQPLITGVGPVEAALQTATALAHLNAQNTQPDLVVSLGSAGSASLTHCGLYQVSQVSWRDIDATPLGFPAGITPFLDLPALLPLPLRLPGVDEATLSTGADIISGGGYDALAEDMVDMETFAVWRACMTAGLPMIGLRGISDGKSDLSDLRDWTEALPVIDQKLAQGVDILKTSLESGLLA